MEDSAFTVQCCVDGPELRSLSKMLACCDRVGKEVYLQATETGIVLRSLNLSQSAFVVFNLKLDFFADFLWNPHDQGRSVSIKLFLKNVVAVFKNVAALEKAWLQLACGGGESYLRIQQFCKNGTRKKFDLAFENAIEESWTTEKIFHSLAAGAVPIYLATAPPRSCCRRGRPSSSPTSPPSRPSRLACATCSTTRRPTPPTTSGGASHCRRRCSTRASAASSTSRARCAGWRAVTGARPRARAGGRRSE